MRDATHWSPTEALPRPELEALQVRRLRVLLAFLWQEKPFYRDRLQAAGVRPEAFRRLEDLRTIPYTEKADLLDWEAKGLGPSPEEVARWHQTSGTTGRPVRVGDTREDWYAYGDLSAAALYGMGVRQGDTVLPAFSYGPHIAFWSYIQAVERIGATLVPAGGLTSQARVALLRDYRATVLLCTPSYSLHLHEVAVAMGLEPRRDLCLRLIIHTGEPNPPATKRRVTALWGAPQCDRIGTTETGGFAFECPFFPGRYHIQENFVVPEVLDLDTREPVAPGGVGELFLTPLFRRGMPVLRFRTGNVVRLEGLAVCPCGRTFLSLAETEVGVVVRRTDELTKVRGVLISPAAFEGVLRGFAELGHEYQLVVERVGTMDEVTLRVEVRPDVPASRRARLQEEIQEAARRALLIRVQVECLPLETLPRGVEKARRLVDRRPAE